MKKKTSYFIDPENSPKIKQMAGLETTILTGLHGEKMMMVLNSTFPGHTVETHTHPHEQVGIIYSGKAEMWIGSEKKIIRKGDFYRIPANIPHGDRCIGSEPFVMLDIFYPIREIFIEKLKEQKNKK